MKKIFLFLSVLLLTSCTSANSNLPVAQKTPEPIKNQTTPVTTGSYKVRMDFSDATIDGKAYLYALPNIVVNKNGTEAIFGNLTIKSGNKTFSGYLLAGKDGKIYMQEYNVNKPTTLSMSDAISCYDVGSWSKSGTLDTTKAEIVNFEPNANYTYDAVVTTNTTTNPYLTLISSKEVTSVDKKRSDMLSIAK